jgi:hypothetical protein
MTSQYKSPKTYLVPRNHVMNLIKNDIDNYVSGMTQVDLHARRSVNKQDYINKSLIDFNTEEDTINACFKRCLYVLNEVNNRLYLLSPSFNNIEWHISFFNGINYEDGLAHTRFNIIFLPVKILSISDEQLVRLLVHEKIHIIQKSIPFDPFIVNYMKQYTVVGHKYYVNTLIRANPDSDDFVYRNGKGEIMMFVYKDNTPTSINDVIKLSQYEHPYEQMAYYYSNL